MLTGMHLCGIGYAEEHFNLLRNKNKLHMHFNTHNVAQSTLNLEAMLMGICDEVAIGSNLKAAK